MSNYTVVPRQEEAETEVEMKSYNAAETKHEGKSSTSDAAKTVGAPPPPVPAGWTARGLPVGNPRVQRDEWESSISSCLGKNDEFHSSDVEVCVLGCCAPCVLHGSSAERMGGSAAGTFATHCVPYAGLYLMGSCLFGWNCLAPWFSYPNRTAIRRKFNLEGSCEAMAGSIGCSENIRMDEVQHEHCESACDLATHVLCHPCALCQEAREVRRRLPHPGFTAKPVIVMLPPGGQAMGR
ncbi:PLAC8 family protein [Perilla frutescens var. hirtella]|nr:PLAC8 family protein [Perilla frutescens var. hirtella]